MASRSTAVLGWFDGQFMSPETLPPWVRSHPRSLFVRGVAEMLFSAIFIYWAVSEPGLWFAAVIYSASTAWTFRTWIWIRA